MSILLSFEKLHNTRDLGGMKTTDGKTVRKGMLIRSGHLSEISDADARALGNMLSAIIDLRTDDERSEKPDLTFPGVTYYSFPLMDSMTAGVSREEASDKEAFARFLQKPEDAKDYMIRIYRNFAVSEAVAKEFSAFLKVLLSEHNKAVLWHCTAGKDRAGIASVLVEEILGVSREEIISDYLLTNEYIKNDVLYLTEFVKQMAGTTGEAADESLWNLFSAKEEYIRAYYDKIDELYGGTERYLKDALHIDDSQKERLKEIYLA